MALGNSYSLTQEPDNKRTDAVNGKDMQLVDFKTFIWAHSSVGIMPALHAICYNIYIKLRKEFKNMFDDFDTTIQCDELVPEDFNFDFEP